MDTYSSNDIEDYNNIKSDKRFVQSCITNITFPSSIEDVFNMIEKNSYVGNQILDMDIILECNKESDIYWTAPRWISKGDIIFFYHGVCAKNKIRSLLKQSYKDYYTDSNLINILSHAENIANKYCGTVFACATVGEDPTQFKDEEGLQHFKGTIFALLDEVYVFKNPLPKDKLYKIVKINRCGSITSVFEQEFDKLKKVLQEDNTLPYFLKNAYQEKRGFHYINRDNWTLISCSDEAKFVNEAQVRAYYIDYLLDAIRDKRTPILKECNCYRNAKRTGIADYFIKLNNYWVPVEAKYNLSFEEDIIRQINKYMNINSIAPTVGRNYKNIKINVERAQSNRCLVIDKYGIYTFIDGKFTYNFNNPLIKRENINENNLSFIRNKICQELQLE